MKKQADKSTTDVTPEQLDKIADLLEGFAGRYREIAGEMRKSGFSTLPLTGMATMWDKTIDYLSGNVNRSTGILHRAKDAKAKVDFATSSQLHVPDDTQTLPKARKAKKNG